MKGCINCNLTYPGVADNRDGTCGVCGTKLVLVEVRPIGGSSRVVATITQPTGVSIQRQARLDEMKKQFGDGRCLTCGRVVGRDQDFCTKNCEETFDAEFERTKEQVKLIMQSIHDIEKEPDESFV